MSFNIKNKSTPIFQNDLSDRKQMNNQIFPQIRYENWNAIFFATISTNSEEYIGIFRKLIVQWLTSEKCLKFRRQLEIQSLLLCLREMPDSYRCVCIFFNDVFPGRGRCHRKVKCDGEVEGKALGIKKYKK